MDAREDPRFSYPLYSTSKQLYGDQKDGSSSPAQHRSTPQHTAETEAETDSDTETETSEGSHHRHRYLILLLSLSKDQSLYASHC